MRDQGDLDSQNLLWCEFCRPIDIESERGLNSLIGSSFLHCQNDEASEMESDRLVKNFSTRSGQLVSY
jgi:hypothetical protein